MTCRSKLLLCAITERLEWKGVASDDPDDTIRGVPLLSADGGFHLFADRWPELHVSPGWRESSEITHHFGDRPEDLFVLRSVVVSGSAHR